MTVDEEQLHGLEIMFGILYELNKASREIR